MVILGDHPSKYYLYRDVYSITTDTILYHPTITNYRYIIDAWRLWRHMACQSPPCTQHLFLAITYDLPLKPQRWNKLQQQQCCLMVIFSFIITENASHPSLWQCACMPPCRWFTSSLPRYSLRNNATRAGCNAIIISIISCWKQPPFIEETTAVLHCHWSMCSSSVCLHLVDLLIERGNDLLSRAPIPPYCRQSNAFT